MLTRNQLFAPAGATVVLKTVCDPVGGGRDDLEAQTGKYECMAVRTENTDGTMRGYSYSGTINYDEFTYSWQLGD
jgi:hypothetical protein